MKYIVKQNEPEDFTKWKALKNEEWTPTYDKLSGVVKIAVKQALMTEQGYICCYCERRLTDNDSYIEHFRPQENKSTDPLDFKNMLCSCQQRLKKGDPRHCGNRKDDWFDEQLLVSPFDSGSEKRFTFTGDGYISSAQSADRAATETVLRLGLDIPKLRSLRKSAIEPFLDESLSQDEATRFVSGYLQLDSRGMYGEFWTTIRYLFGD
ncbi:MAG: retron system putative HNH endonuclease [Chlorobiaceae bacterium]